MTLLLAAARAVHFGSLMAVFGGSGYAALLRRAELCAPPRKSARALFMASAELALVSGIVWFCLIAGQMSGSWQGALDPAILRLAASATRFGHIFVARLAGLVLLWSMCALTKRSNDLALCVVAGILLASLAPISHAGASDGNIAFAGAASDGAHLLAAGAWVGGLAILGLLIARHWTDPAALIGPLRIFSVWGIVVVALLVLTGAINAISILPFSQMTLRNPYFDLLLTKVALAVAMVGLAALNRWRFAPALAGGGETAVRHLGSSVGLELTLAFLVLGIVGYLGTMAPH